MSNQSGTIGRTNRASSLTSNQMKRQRSAEWQHEHDYSSSEEENDRIGRISEASVNHHNPSPSRDSSSVLAQLIAQTQQLTSKYFCASSIANIIKLDEHLQNYFVHFFFKL